jgi:hypothetical protein
VSLRGIPGQIRTLGQTALVDVLPDDAWFSVGGGANGPLRTDGFTSGRPVPDGELLRVVTAHSLRLGLAVHDAVTGAVEVRFGHRVGEVALAEPDGSGRYLAVVHVWRSGHAPADQFQVVRLSGEQIVESFALSDARFADTPPLGRFRLGRDGNLYQLRTFPFGLRIVRFELGGES